VERVVDSLDIYCVEWGALKEQKVSARVYTVYDFGFKEKGAVVGFMGD